MDGTPFPGSNNSKNTYGRRLHRRAATEPDQQLPQSTAPLRWSEIVSPDSALMFAVMSDGDQEFEFSDSGLLQTPKHDSKATPLDVTDAQSQILLLPGQQHGNNTALPGMVDDGEPHTATLASFRDNHEFLFRDDSTLKLPPKFDDTDRPSLGGTQVSSTLDGVGDVYITGSMFSNVYGVSARLTRDFEKLDGNFHFDPTTPFVYRLSTPDKPKKEYEDEGVINEDFLEISTDGLPSGNASSPTKTSAQDSFLELRARPVNPLSNQLRRLDRQEADDKGQWSFVETPRSPAALRPLRFATQQEAQRRRLRKVRPALSPTSDSTGFSKPKSPSSPAISFVPSIYSIAASPSLVLKRTKYNHEPLSPNPNSFSLPSRQDNFYSPRPYFPILEAVREGMALARPRPPLPCPGVPVASFLTKLVRSLGNICKCPKSSVHKGRDGWVFVDIKQEITLRNV